MKPAIIGYEAFPADLAIIDSLWLNCGMLREDAIRMIFQAGIEAVTSKTLLEVLEYRYALAKAEIDRQVRENESGSDYSLDADFDLGSMRPRPTLLEAGIEKRVTGFAPTRE